VSLLANQNLLQLSTVTAGGANYNVTTSNYYALTTQYGTMSQTLSSLQNLGCLIDSYQGAPVYSNTAFNNSSVWISFLICSLVSAGNILIT
jgi:hypothetical protein